MIRVVQNPKEANCITHSGTMHADEVFATAFLDLYFQNITVYRTNQVPENLDSDVLVYDIGRGKFDHHQLDAEKRENGIPYSSFGLLWREFGKDYLTREGFSNIEKLFLGIDSDLVEGIDGDDNGVFPKIEAPYKVKAIPQIIRIFNPSFDSNENENDQFMKAVELAKSILKEEFIYMNGKVMADEKVGNILDHRDLQQKYLILEEYIPYEDALLRHENTDNILFVAFPSNRGGYAIKTVPISIEDKNPRMAFPEEWAGLVDQELETVSQIEGLGFCHTGRFIVNCKTKEAMYQVLDKLCQEA